VVRLLLEKGANISADVDWAKYNGRNQIRYAPFVLKSDEARGEQRSRKNLVWKIQ